MGRLRGWQGDLLLKYLTQNQFSLNDKISPDFYIHNKTHMHKNIKIHMNMMISTTGVVFEYSVCIP